MLAGDGDQDWGEVPIGCSVTRNMQTKWHGRKRILNKDWQAVYRMPPEKNKNVICPGGEYHRIFSKVCWKPEGFKDDAKDFRQDRRDRRDRQDRQGLRHRPSAEGVSRFALGSTRYWIRKLRPFSVPL
jgi:hypothetical protein